jgi:alkanesulfonate monooxygenase
MLQFQPFEAEMERFAKEIIPRVRALQAAGSFEKPAALAAKR